MTSPVGRGVRLTAILSAAAMASACVEMEDDVVETGDTAQASTVLIGNIYQNGTLVSFDRITPTGLNVANVVGLAACDTQQLYAVEKQGALYKIFLSKDGGETWTAQALPGKGREIACDHSLLATVDAGGELFITATAIDGRLIGWETTGDTVKVERIGGGDGSFYGVKSAGVGRNVYLISVEGRGHDVCNWDNDTSKCPLNWGSPIANVGAERVTGTGARTAGRDGKDVVPGVSWPRRAFALEYNGTISTNSTLLDYQNWWGSLDTGSERYKTIVAAAPNLLYGIEGHTGTLFLHRIRIEETSCSDGVDNDSNGLTDSEDDNGSNSCRNVRAAQFCATAANGFYCADRYQPTTFLGEPNPSSSLVQCWSLYGRKMTSITPGYCKRNAFGQDRLFTTDELAAPPTGLHPYCNVHWSDGVWDLDWSSNDPCLALKGSRPGLVPTVVRAGYYSTAGMNNVFVRCSDGLLNPSAGNGLTPLTNAYFAVGHNNNRCVFQISPATLGFFDKMLNGDQQTATPGHFGHTPGGVAMPLAPFGWGESGTGVVERNGHSRGQNEAAYDIEINENRPLYAPANGRVIDAVANVADGSRVRDVSNWVDTTTPTNTLGSIHQQEMFVEYSIGVEPYRETFVVYYAHVRKRMVVDGQTVKAGQKLAYVGANGNTSGGYAHVHIGVSRTSNTNRHTPTADAGYRSPIIPTATGVNATSIVDPLGWGNSFAPDPWALQWDSGDGGWSPNLFKPGKQFIYNPQY